MGLEAPATKALIITGSILFAQGQSVANIRTLTVGYPSTWGELIPSLQADIYADSILGNVFEPLVGMDPGGRATPLAATSWSISQDLKTITFKIDTLKRFSNGKKLSSSDFKKSWEYAYSHASGHGKQALASVLENVVGSESFHKTNSFSGIETPDPETLVLKFKKPFRTVLDQLSLSRYSVFSLDKAGHFYGTGHYVLCEGHTESAAFLESHPFGHETPFTRIKIHAYEDAKLFDLPFRVARLILRRMLVVPICWI